MAMSEDEENELHREAKEAILRRIIEATPRSSSAKFILDLAEAYVVLDRMKLSGAINAPVK